MHIAVISSVVAAFFYIRLIALMYMQEPAESAEIERAPVATAAVGVGAALTVLFGVVPALLFGFLRHASVVRF